MNYINLENPAYLEAKSLSKLWESYSENCSREDIFEVGFNENSGYVYIALETNITLVSSFGQDVEYLVTDFETGDESFFETIDEAKNHLDKIEATY
jgi:hypothetical protein